MTDMFKDYTGSMTVMHDEMMIGRLTTTLTPHLLKGCLVAISVR